MHDLVAARDRAAKEPSDAAMPPSVAIIGMSGRFPQAENLDEFWSNLIAGRDCISHFSVEELREAGIDPMALSNPKYVRAKGVLANSLSFDAALFGFSPREAEIIDPQQRILLECAMAALEDASCNPDTFDGSIGVFAGGSSNSYLAGVPRSTLGRLEHSQVATSNDKDFIASRISYKLNLKGPSVVVLSACSTSLVAVCTAYNSLLDYQCDVALAGAACATFPQKSGYIHTEGSIHSRDGYCRAFDADGSGLVGGNGVGVVVMKRLEDAIADRDHIHAVIRGGAINNDGSLKVGYTAPSVDGQADAISLAYALGDIDPSTITYIEAHGTGTRIGDPIEIAGLTKAFRRKSSKVGSCGIGSVKTNIGHLDTAAGMAGLIKTVLAMKHRQIPPSINFSTPNPEIDFDSSPFSVCTGAKPWDTGNAPLRAGVSSFGIGGTNVHVVLEEAPAAEAAFPAERRHTVLTLSANTAAALKRVAAGMGAHLRRTPSIDLADAAYSLQVGRKAWKHRLAVVCSGTAEAADILDGLADQGAFRGQAETSAARVAFLFPGQGAQHVGMTRGLYAEEPVFRDTLDECAERLIPNLGVDLRELIFAPETNAAAAAQLDQTQTTQPALFAVEYSLAKLWMSWGVHPVGMMGHSLGEYVAACLGGVMDLPAALRLISRRGALMQSLPFGDMASVPLSDEEVTPLLTGGLSIAAVLGPNLCVVSGSHVEVEALRTRLADHGVVSRPIRTSHAFHSKDMDPILPAFAAAFEGIRLQPPRIPFISNVSGTWITESEATDPNYWVRQLRGMVQLRAGFDELTRTHGTVCIEVGPGRSLCALSQQAVQGRRIEAIASCRDRNDPTDDARKLMGALAKLWTIGGDIDWSTVSAGAERRKVPLPTYPFDREVYSLLPPPPGAAAAGGQKEARRNGLMTDLLFAPTWRRATPLAAKRLAENPEAAWLVFLDANGLGARCAARLRELGRTVVTVGLDTGGEREGTADHWVGCERPDGIKKLFEILRQQDINPTRILHLWNVGALDPARRVHASRTLGFDSLLYIVQVLGAADGSKEACHITVAATGLADVDGSERLEAEKALLIGPCRVAPVEHPHLTCKMVDVALPDVTEGAARLVDMLLTEASQAAPAEVALRGNARWVPGFETIYFNPHGDPPPALPQCLRENGTYLITGGLGGIGLEIAVHLAEKFKARLILTARSLPSSESEAAAKTLGMPAVADRIVAIEKAGGEVMTASADVTDRAAMATIVEQARERFGAIHGVVHSAGVAGRGIMQLKTKADVDSVLSAKVDGTLALHEIFVGSGLDFFVVCSSLAAVVGAPGQAEYTSANAYLDHFVAEHRHEYERLLSINWDRWAVVGMAAKETAQQPGHADAVLIGLDPTDGAIAFELALNSAESQIAVALGPLEWIARFGPPRAAPAAAQAGETRGYSRPDLDTAFEAPTNDLEIGVAAMFHEVLGIKDVGIDDNFFDLGGHSLVGVQLVNKIQETYAVEIGVGELFVLPTVRNLSRTIAARQASQPAEAAGAKLEAAASPA